MNLFNKELFQLQIEQRRQFKSLRETAKEIGINYLALHRIVNGTEPTIENFFKICNWLQWEPSNFINQ